MKADAADEAAISGVCKQALDEEGRLDVFFANVITYVPPYHSGALIAAYKAGIATMQPLQALEADLFMRTMKINTLSLVPRFPFSRLTLAYLYDNMT